MARIIAISSQKGGVGKTTTAANLATAWGAQGSRVLAVDFDPQFALTRAFGWAPSQAAATAYEVVKGDSEIPDAVLDDVAPGVALLAGHRELSALELTLAGQMKREEFLERALAGAADLYDVVLIDCPPNLGLLTVNAIFAAPEVIVPVSMTDPGALQGVGEVRATVATVAAWGIDVRVSAVLRTYADTRLRSYAEIDAALAELGLPIARVEIPRRQDFSNAAIAGQPLLQWRPDSVGAQAYRRLADELGAPRLKAVA